MVLDSLEELDGLTRVQGHHRLLPVRAAAAVATHALLLAAHDAGADVLHLDGEERLDGLPDLDLVRVERDLEQDDRLHFGHALELSVRTAARLARARALLREEGTLHDAVWITHCL